MESINIEVALTHKGVRLTESDLTSKIEDYFLNNPIHSGSNISNFHKDSFLEKYVEHICVGESNNEVINIKQVNPKWHFYTLNKEGPQYETIEKENQSLQIGTLYQLPSADFSNLWESLVFEDKVKEHLLKYVSTTLYFSDKGVDSNIISCNRLILLYGPPGTGKTSLCKALSQKLSIQLSHRFQTTILFEINTNNLFSKWFSESGKLVTQLFSKIRDFSTSPTTLICIIIDEIESLVHARDACFSGREPSDAIRVVNAVLTEIDQLKRYKNILILTTSNMTNALDLAFVDRADIKQYIGLPNAYGIYQIYLSCIQELMKTGIIRPLALIPTHYQNGTDSSDNSFQLFKVCEQSVDLSGRTLRKIPFLAHALFAESEIVTLTEYFHALSAAVKHCKNDKGNFK